MEDLVVQLVVDGVAVVQVRVLLLAVEHIGLHGQQLGKLFHQGAVQDPDQQLGHQEAQQESQVQDVAYFHFDNYDQRLSHLDARKGIM